ncbi:TnsA-like heteromeric transposase endonuclease subunit [Streptomyces sp. MspMP-M5]|uniref:TnsA-like heteromeric transposase endonuclease subunit n=1 Tax=unclassified Streptomyces TaxID=2593676 RepID=UPI00039DAB99|nr:TnsA-like heteromeric transposase endonuclease subunit [Streptomyces sp. MspMP-M5]
MPFAQVAPARAFASNRNQRNLSGLWWSATVGGHVGYESWLEHDQLMLLGFDPAVVGICSQPFWLFWAANDRPGWHAPDYFARRADGTALVVVCRPVERRRPRVGRSSRRLGRPARRWGGSSSCWEPRMRSVCGTSGGWWATSIPTIGRSGRFAAAGDIRRAGATVGLRRGGGRTAGRAAGVVPPFVGSVRGQPSVRMNLHQIHGHRPVGGYFDHVPVRHRSQWRSVTMDDRVEAQPAVESVPEAVAFPDAPQGMPRPETPGWSLYPIFGATSFC